jgi:hypothetical protein
MRTSLGCFLTSEPRPIRPARAEGARRHPDRAEFDFAGAFAATVVAHELDDVAEHHVALDVSESMRYLPQRSHLICMNQFGNALSGQGFLAGQEWVVAVAAPAARGDWSLGHSPRSRRAMPAFIRL